MLYMKVVKIKILWGSHYTHFFFYFLSLWDDGCSKLNLLS